MCNTAFSPLFVTPDVLSDTNLAAHPTAYYESLLATAMIVSTMGNHSSSSPSSSPSLPHSPPHPSHVEHYPLLTKNSLSSLIQRLCSSLAVASILGGPMPPTPGILPMCWDELVDWAEHATCMTQELRYNTYNDEPRNTNSNDAQEQQQGFQIVFEPHVVDRQSGPALEKIASQTYMERAQFYQDSVLVAVKRKDTGGLVSVISVFEFCRYYTLVSRRSDLADLLNIQQNPPCTSRAPTLSCDTGGSPVFADPLSGAQQLPSSGQQPQECVICCNRTEDAVLVCCNHALCSECERKWVHKRLKCPFCRQSFRSLQDAVQSQWQWNVAAAPVEQVQKDIRSLQRKIEAFWKIHPLEKNRDDTENQQHEPAWEQLLLQNYTQPKKFIRGMQDSKDGFVIIVR